MLSCYQINIEEDYLLKVRYIFYWFIFYNSYMYNVVKIKKKINL